MANLQRKIQVKRSPRLFLLIGLAILVIASIIIAIATQRTTPNTTQTEKPKYTKEQLLALWQKKDYKTVYEASKQFNDAEPYTFDILLYFGFSAFYYGISFTTDEEKLPFLKESIVNLRKAKILEPFRNNSDIDYILGLIYFELGYYYNDLAYSYLKRANDAGNRNTDLLEHLGVVANSIGNLQEAVGILQQAKNEKNKYSINLSIAKTYLDLDDVGSAEPLIMESANNSSDPIVLEKAKFLQAAIYVRQKKIDQALNIYLSIVKANPNSADAHFYLGEMYNEKSDVIKARAEWRNATNLNPKHSGAINRLNSNN